MSDSKGRDRKVRDDERSHIDDWSDPSKKPQMNPAVMITIFGLGLILLIVYGALTS